MKKFRTIILLLFVSVSFAQQKLNPELTKIQERARCSDSAVVEFFNIEKLENFRGRVSIAEDNPVVAIIEVYSVSKAEAKLNPYQVAEKKKPFKIIKTNGNGEFYLDDLMKGYYMLKVGTDNGGFNCNYLKIKITENVSNKPFEIKLSLGT